MIRVVDALVVPKPGGGWTGVEFNEVEGVPDQPAAMPVAGYLGLIAPENIDEVGTARGGTRRPFSSLSTCGPSVSSTNVASASRSFLSSSFIPHEVIDEAEGALLANESP